MIASRLQPAAFCGCRAAVVVACLVLIGAFCAVERDCRGQDDPPRARTKSRENADDPDRLPNKLERKVLKAVREGKPDRVAKLLAKRHPSFRAYVAWAHVKAGFLAEDPAEKTAQFDAAVKVYRDILTLREDRTWFRGDARQAEVVGWYVEMGDVLLRHLVAPDLDRYEITSGLAFDARPLLQQLREAYDAYQSAGEILDDLNIGLRTEEERFLLLGIADKITTLDQQRRLNGAWAGTYLAMVGGEELAGRSTLLSEALSAFDALSRTAREPELKYNALLGAAVALRESGRFAEADAALNRVQQSTASASLLARSRYERARTLLRANRFREAREELDALAAMHIDPSASNEAGATFYIRLAPLIHAYSYILEAQGVPPRSKLQKDQLLARGREALTAIAGQGGIWPDIVQLYENALDGGNDPNGRPSLGQLRQRSTHAMSKRQYAEAVDMLKEMLEHPEADEATKQEARFNLGVCHFQMGNLRLAAEAFSEASRDSENENAARAPEYAYRCWRQLAADTKAKDDYLLLAHAAELLVERTAESPAREEIEWIAALARQEAGDYGSAQVMYSRIARKTDHYWQARRNMARCRQSAFDELSHSTSLPRRQRAARDAIEAWTDLAMKLRHAMEAKDDAEDGLVGLSGVEEAAEWIRDATLSAATLLTDDVVNGFDEALRLLATLEPTPRVLALRIRCYRGMGNVEAANRAIESFLSQAAGPELGGILAGLAADMENETQALRRSGRTQEARRVAGDMVAILRQLLVWMKQHPGNERHDAIIRFSLAKAQRQAGDFADALQVLESLMQENPDDGGYLREAALTQEELAEATPRTRQSAEFDKAEALWERLLRDASLRNNAPDVYWEARLRWLKHQLRHGRAAEVARAIETERAWFPELGGPPWQRLLLDLAAEARRCAPTDSRPADAA